MSAHLWKEIARTIGMETMDCTKKWKNLRDEDVCFLKTNKRKEKLTTTKSGNAGGKKSQHFVSAVAGST